MSNKANNPDRLLSIYDDLTRAFKSVDAFYTYYNTHLTSINPATWGKEVEKKIFEIHTFLEGVLVEQVKNETVLLWLHNIELLKEDIDIIAYRIDMDLKTYKAYEKLPEAIFLPETIEADMHRTGKSYAELEPMYLKGIQKEIKLLSSIRPYSDASLQVVSRSLKEMQSRFEPIISAKGINNTSTISVNEQKGISTPKKVRARSNRKNFPPPVGFEHISTFELLDKRLNISALHDKLVASPGFIAKDTRNNFEKLFNCKVESFTIEWRGQVNQLSYFVQQLIKRGMISKYRAWMAAQKHFTIGGKSVGPNLSRADSINKDVKKKIEAVLSVLPQSTTN